MLCPFVIWMLVCCRPTRHPQLVPAVLKIKLFTQIQREVTTRHDSEQDVLASSLQLPDFFRQLCFLFPWTRVSGPRFAGATHAGLIHGNSVQTQILEIKTSRGGNPKKQASVLKTSQNTWKSTSGLPISVGKKWWICTMRFRHLGAAWAWLTQFGFVEDRACGCRIQVRSQCVEDPQSIKMSDPNSWPISIMFFGKVLISLIGNDEIGALPIKVPMKSYQLIG